VEEALAYLSGHSSELLYVALFLVLVVCGVGIPVPEDVPLITAGFLCYSGDMKLGPAIAISMVAVLIGDTLIYFIGYHWGLSILTHPIIRRFLPESRLERVRRYFNRYGDRTIFFARFIVGLRAATFWAAGTLKVKYSKFLFFDGLAALLSVPAFILVGWYFGDDIEKAMHLLDRIEFVLLVVAVVAIGGFVYWEIKRRKGDSTEH
jgi:membrane protein DedA with SNARE-associated domain